MSCCRGLHRHILWSLKAEGQGKGLQQLLACTPHHPLSPGSLLFHKIPAEGMQTQQHPQGTGP